MDVVARPLCQPAFDERRLVGAMVVHDEMDIEVGGDSCIDGIEELPELNRAVLAVAVANNLARGHVQGSEERSRPMAHVVVRTSLNLARAHRQQGLCSVERLDLGLLINAEDERPFRRVEVEANDVAYLLDKERVSRELEGSGLAPN